jgi:hypothetical protein
MLSVLADGRKLISFVILKRKNFPKKEKSFQLELYLNVMT